MAGVDDSLGTMNLAFGVWRIFLEDGVVDSVGIDDNLGITNLVFGL